MSLLDDYEPEKPRILPVVLLLDTSGSMAEDDKIDVLNDSVTEMIEELTEVDDGHGAINLSIITFGKDGAKLVLDSVPIADVEYASLRANGRTPMGGRLPRRQGTNQRQGASSLRGPTARPWPSCPTASPPTRVGSRNSICCLTASAAEGDAPRPRDRRRRGQGPARTLHHRGGPGGERGRADPEIPPVRDGHRHAVTLSVFEPDEPESLSRDRLRGVSDPAASRRCLLRAAGSPTKPGSSSSWARRSRAAPRARCSAWPGTLTTR